MSLERFVALAFGLVLLAVAVWSVRRSLKRGDGVVTTLGVFAFIWGCALILFAIPLIRYSTTPVGVWMMVYGSIVTFVLGALWGERRYRDLPRVPAEDRQRPDARRLRFAWIFFAVLGLLGFAAYVHAVDVVVGWRAIFETPEIVRVLQTNSVTFSDTYGPWKLLTYFNQVAFILWTLAMRERIFQGRWRVAWVLGPLSLAPFIFSGDRTLIMVSLIWAAAFQMMYMPPIKLRRLLAGSAIGVVALVSLFVILGGQVGKTVDRHPEIASNLTTRAVDPLALPYLYATGNVPAFGGLVDDPLRPETNGQVTLLSGVKLLHGLNLWGQPPEKVGAFYSIPFQTYNNFSWLGIFYSDFGVFGVLILPFLFAFVTSAVVMRAIRRRTLLSVWTASLLVYCVIFTFDAYKFFDTLISEYFLLGLVVIPFIRQDLGPQGVMRRLRDVVREHPKLAAAGALVATALCAVALAGLVLGGSDEGLSRSQAALTDKLESAAEESKLTLEDGAYPIPEALASRLHVNDPAVRYIGVNTEEEAPTDPETISVYTDDDRLVLRAQIETGGFISYDSATGKVTSDTVSMNTELVTNGGFEDGMRDWEVKRGQIARTSITGTGFKSRKAAKIVGTGESGTSVEFSQIVPLSAPPGTCFRFSVWTRGSKLSRPLLVWVSLLHPDGSASPQLTAGEQGEGVGPGSSPWQRSVASGELTDPMIAARLFVADTGLEPLSGTAWVDNVSLRRTC